MIPGDGAEIYEKAVNVRRILTVLELVHSDFVVFSVPSKIDRRQRASDRMHTSRDANHELSAFILRQGSVYRQSAKTCSRHVVLEVHDIFLYKLRVV